MYEDEDGIVICHTFDNKFIIHSELKKDITNSLLKKAKQVSEEVDIAFKTKGVDTLYTWAETEAQDRYNIFLGYEPTGANVTMPDNYPNIVREYKKVLN